MANVVYHIESTYGFFMRAQNFSVYILIDLEAFKPLPMLCLRISNESDVSLNKIKFGKLGYFSYLCIVKVNVYIYESNKQNRNEIRL
jgi:hypothetical protein